MTTFRLSFLSAAVAASSFVVSASAQVACTMDAKMCPDGSYVGRDANNNCEFKQCPPVACPPYVCADGTTVARCAEDGTVINYFAEPCLTHGGDAQEPVVCQRTDDCPAGSRCSTEWSDCMKPGCTGVCQAEAECHRECRAAGTRSEGWYDSCSGTLIEFAQCASGPFSDVSPDHANAKAIAYLKANGIVQGYADGTFRPDATINRAEFLKILLQAETSLYDGDGMAPTYAAACFMHETKQQFIAKYGKFPDVGFDSWYGGYFCSAVRMSIIQGYPDGTFRPSADINFAEAAKIIVMTLEVATDAGHTAPLEPWYRPFVTDLEVYHAIPTSIKSLDQKITRGEMAEMIWRLKAGVTDLPSKTYEDFHFSFEATETFSDDWDTFTLTYPKAWTVQIGKNDIDMANPGRFISVARITPYTVPGTCPEEGHSQGTTVQTVQLGGHPFTAYEQSDGSAGTWHELIVFVSQVAPDRCIVLEKRIDNVNALEENDADHAEAQRQIQNARDQLKDVLKSIIIH